MNNSPESTPFRGTQIEIRFTIWLFIFMLAGSLPFILHIVGKLLNYWPTVRDDTNPAHYTTYAVIFWMSIISISITMANLGVWTSFFFRTKLARMEGAPVVDRIDIFSIFMSYCFGAVIGIIIVFIFAGGFIKGNLFPDFQFSNGSLFGLLFLAADWCRLIVWTFVAGFSERLIPQFLDDLVGKFGRRPNDIG